MPDDVQGNVGVNEPFVIWDLEPGLLDVAGFWPIAGGVANNVNLTPPWRTYGWTRIVGFVASDQAFTFRTYFGRTYNNATNRLARISTSGTYLSSTDPETGLDVYNIDIPASVGPFVIFEVENTSGVQQTVFEVYIALRV
jgi:hypothetical protein